MSAFGLLIMILAIKPYTLKRTAVHEGYKIGDSENGVTSHPKTEGKEILPQVLQQLKTMNQGVDIDVTRVRW